MNTRFLETFVWLCRLKNFNAVAEKLHTTQPGVSQRIAALEDRLRQKLYVRGSKEFELTPAGRHLLSYAERIVDLSNELLKELCIDEEKNTVVRIGIIEMVTMSWLANFVQLIRNHEPTATVDFTTETSQELVNKISRGELDIAFVWGPINEPSISNTHICTFPMSWLANPQFYDCSREIDVVELAKMPVIMNRPNTSGYSMILDYFINFGIEHVPESPEPVSLNCSYSLATAMQLVRTGLGIMAIPPFTMAKEIADGTVEILPVTQQLPSIHLTACVKESSGKIIFDSIVALAQSAAHSYAQSVDSDFYHV